jgi:hypothetical protein
LITLSYEVGVAGMMEDRLYVLWVRACGGYNFRL